MRIFFNLFTKKIKIKLVIKIINKKKVFNCRKTLEPNLSTRIK